MEEVFEGIEKIILDESRIQLGKDFNVLEIKEAIAQMNPNKAHSLDGMTGCFHQKF